MRLWFIAATAIVITLLILATGCVSAPGTAAENVTPAVSPPTAGIPVPAAPYQIYIKSGQSEQFTYRGHTIAVRRAG